MIKYSKKARKALTFLFRNYNDIDIYVEDTTCRNMWEIIINRILKGRARVSRVFELGCRQEVIKGCKNDRAKNYRPRLYIIDGDLDILIGKNPPILDRLYRLNVYCSENLLLSKSAFLEVCYESMVTCDRRKVEKEIVYDKVFSELVRKLKPLFVIYGVAYILNPKLKTTKYHVNNLYKQRSNNVILSKKKINARIKTIKSSLRQNYSNKIIRKEIAKIEKELPSEIKEIMKFISAKTYLLPFMYIYLQKKIKIKCPLKEMKVRFARYCDLNIDGNLIDAIRTTSKGIVYKM